MLPTSPPARHYKSKNSFNYSAKPMNLHDIPSIDSALQILSLQISEQGKSGGVLFLETNYGALVLKANSSTPKQFFFNELALTLEVNVPTMDIIGCYEEQFQGILFAVEKYCCDDEVLYARVRNKLNFPFYEIIQFVPSVSFVSVGSQKFAAHLLQDEKMYSIGMCLAFDMVINNNDRFSFVWRGEGTINNILIAVPAELRPLQLERARDRGDSSVKLEKYVFIDHGGNMADIEDRIAAENIEKYMQKATELQLNMIMYLRKETSTLPSEFEKLAKQIQFFTKYTLTQDQIILICEGLVYGTQNFIRLYQTKEIHALYETILKPTDSKSKEQNYWNDFWNRELKAVHISFLELYYTKVSAIYITYPELISAIVEKVKQKMQGSNNKNKRVSQLGRPGSNLSNRSGRKEGAEREQEGEGRQDGGGGGEGEQTESAKQRRWREKLEAFKSQNYK